LKVSKWSFKALMKSVLLDSGIKEAIFR